MHDNFTKVAGFRSDNDKANGCKPELLGMDFEQWWEEMYRVRRAAAWADALQKTFKISPGTTAKIKDGGMETIRKAYAVGLKSDMSMRDDI
eukprot:9527113-Karenia_brevis.AAC.1